MIDLNKPQPILCGAVSGCDESQIEEYLSAASEIALKPVGVVSDWEVTEHHVPDAFLELIREDLHALPARLAGKLVISATDRFKTSDLIQTSYIMHIHKQCIVETLNSMYVLTGSGSVSYRDENDVMHAL